MKLKIYIIILLPLVLLTGCFRFFLCIEGSGTIVKEERAVANFTNLEIFGSGTVFFFQSQKPMLIIETDDNILQYISTGVEGNSLKIRAREGICPRKINYYIYNNSLRQIKIFGATDFFAQTPIIDSSLEINIFGSGDIRIDSIKANEIDVKISGSGDITFGGQCESLTVNINGSGDVRASKLVSEYSNMLINGSGDCYLWVTEELKARINGSGDILYKGNPRTIKTKINGSGDVIRLDKNLEKAKEPDDKE